MKKFKGTKGEWECIFLSNKSRAVRNKGGIICTLYKPSRYIGQDERYERELEENLNNQRLIAAAPDLLEALQEILEAVDNSVWNHQSLEKGTKAIEKALN